MKRLIATLIKLVMPKAVRQHKRDKKILQMHNAAIMQALLDNEHMIKEAVNKRFDTVYTTKKALETARVYGMKTYSSFVALKEADFR